MVLDLGWPDGGLAPGDSHHLTASGTLSVHGKQRPIQLPLSITEKSKGSQKSLSISTALELQPTDFGIDLPESLTELMGSINVALRLVGYPVPYKKNSVAFNWLVDDAYNIADEFGTANISESHLFLAVFRHFDASLKLRLEELGVPINTLEAEILERLKTKTSKRSKGEPSVDPTVQRLVNREAHFETHRLGEEAVTPEHLLFAFLRGSDHWIVDYLVGRGCTHDQFLAAFKGIPKPAKEVLFWGNPFKRWTKRKAEYAYARNVWDIQVFGDKIYLGHGNSSNRGPARNAGPVKVISYHPRSDRFKKEFTVDEEQIGRYRIIGNQLQIPGHDPRESWDLGNFYRLTDKRWKKVRTIP